MYPGPHLEDELSAASFTASSSNRTTTLIPFLQAIKHFCNFIPSYFMERFTFLIGTSYVYPLDCSGLCTRIMYYSLDYFKECGFDAVLPKKKMVGNLGNTSVLKYNYEVVFSYQLILI